MGVVFAERAVEMAPQVSTYWNTLGIARYRAGDLERALVDLERSMELRTGGNAYDWLFLAMAQQRLGNEGEARAWYERSIAWMERADTDPDLDRFRAETEALLGIEESRDE